MASPVVDINLWAVLVAAVASFIIGMIWYAPGVFGNAWMKLSGIKKAKKKGMVGKMITGFIAGLVMAYTLAHVVGWMLADNFAAGSASGFGMWIGFLVPVLLGSVLWEGKPLRLFMINAGYWLVNLAIMGGILAVW